MVYIQNPTSCPQVYGDLTVPAKGYVAVESTLANNIEASATPLISENNPNFSPLWKTYNRDIPK